MRKRTFDESFQTIRVSQKTDLLSVIRLDARIIVQRWTKMEMRFEIKRGGREEAILSQSLVSLFFGRAIFYPNETKRNQQFEEFLEWTKNRLRGDKEKRVTRLRATTSYGAPRFCSRGSHKCVVLSSNSVLDATFHYVVQSNPPSLASIHKAG